MIRFRGFETGLARDVLAIVASLKSSRFVLLSRSRRRDALSLKIETSLIESPRNESDRTGNWRIDNVSQKYLDSQVFLIVNLATLKVQVPFPPLPFRLFPRDSLTQQTVA